MCRNPGGNGFCPQNKHILGGQCDVRFLILWVSSLNPCVCILPCGFLDMRLKTPERISVSFEGTMVLAEPFFATAPSPLSWIILCVKPGQM